MLTATKHAFRAKMKRNREAYFNTSIKQEMSENYSNWNQKA